jgi:hypothetical protein
MPEEENLSFNNNDRIAKYISYIPRHITNAWNTNIETTTMCTIGSIADSMYKYLEKNIHDIKLMSFCSFYRTFVINLAWYMSLHCQF